MLCDLPPPTPLPVTPPFLSFTALYLPRGNGQETEHREYLPPAWQRAVTYRVVLQRKQKRPPSLPPGEQGGGTSQGGGAAGTFSLFTARVSNPNGCVGPAAAHRGSASRGGGGAGRAGLGCDKPRSYCFVVTDGGIHNVPAAAALGEGEGWEPDVRWR